jgi:GT2 family glycosyltransferase
MEIKTQPKISVMVLNYNGKDFLKDCFRSLEKINYNNYDVYLLDNFSSDGSIEFTKTLFPWVNILAFEKNYGFAEAYNRASKKIKSEYLYFLNNDTKVDKNFLSEAAQSLLKDNQIAAVGSKMYFFDRPEFINYAGGKIDLLGSGFEEGFNKKDNVKYNKEKMTGLCCGGAMLIKRSIFLDVGGFDSSYFMYLEDVDLCWRLWLYGYKVFFSPYSIVYHKYRGTSTRFDQSQNDRGVYLGQKNRLNNTLKNANLLTVARSLILLVFYLIFKFIYFLVHFRFDLIFALFKGNASILINLKSIISKRKEIQSRRKLSDKQLKKMDVIATVNYYIKRKFFNL